MRYALGLSTKFLISEPITGWGGASHMPIMGPRTEPGHLRRLGSEGAVSVPTCLSGHTALPRSDLTSVHCL